MTAVPYRFERTAVPSELQARFGDLEPGTETDEVVSVAGRVMLMRPQGRIAFATLRDATGSVQLFAPSSVTEEFGAFTKLSLGDWIGATGRVMKTRKGELSVQVAKWVLLAEARRPFGDKWKGVTDVETRFRQREVDLWANERTRQVLLMRSAMISLLRRRLEERGFVEVETPMLHAMAGGATAKPFVTHHNALDADLYLRIAPELYLKRLVVGGFDKVFEIGRVFRNEGLSPRHNPEFTMLEAYQAYADYHDFAELVEQLVSSLALDLLGTTMLSYGERQLDLGVPWQRATMAGLVSDAVGEAVDVHSDPARMAKLLESNGGAVDKGWGPGKLLLELYEKTVEPRLWGPVFVTEFPAEVSPLARRHRHDSDLAERFEGIVAGRELVNAFSELVDPDDQRRRFEEQAAAKAAGDEEAMSVDEDYLRALDHGLPPTAGLGIGIDRLAMLLADVANIREVIAFPTLRPER
ncbi:MAG: lysine--tRNA ligase [Acidimicrobiales bacterium]